MAVSLTTYDWALILCELDGTALGEIRDAHDVEISQRLSQIGTLSFRLRSDNALADALLDPVGVTTTGTVLVKAYLNGVLRQVYEITTVEEVGESLGASVAVTCAEACLWRLSHRLVGKSVDGWLPSTGTVAAVAAAAIRRVNATSGTDGGGDTGLRVGVALSSEPVALSEPLRFTPVLEVITQLASAGSGFEYRVDPVEPVADSSGTALGVFNAADAIGTSRPEVVLEYGTPRGNLGGYRRIVSRDQLATVGWSLPDGFPQAAAAPVLTTPASPDTGPTRHEATVTSGVATADVRRLVLSEQIAVRQSARQLIELTPASTAPVAGLAYDVGDVITARAVDPAGGTVRFDALFRVYGISWSVSDVGVCTVTLTVVPDGD